MCRHGWRKQGYGYRIRNKSSPITGAGSLGMAGRNVIDSDIGNIIAVFDMLAGKKPDYV